MQINQTKSQMYNSKRVSSSYEKTDNFKKASLLNNRNLANAYVQELRKSQEELTNTYQKEQLEYFQNQINKIINSIEGMQSPKHDWQ